MEMQKIGIGITSFTVSSFNYPPEVQKMAEKAAAQSMIGDVGRFQQISMGEAMTNGQGGGAAADMAGLVMGMAMSQQMASQMNQNMGGQNMNGQMNRNMSGQTAPGMTGTAGSAVLNFCPNCGTKTNSANFCPNCGQKLV